MRTLVVTPTMLTSAAGIESLVEALEVRFLANRDDALHFGLLTDFRDAPTETLPADAALVESGPGADRGAECKIPAPGRRHLFPVPPSAPLESAASGSGWATSASAASWPI
jgi:cyclic beta-1,2-glucan synthetase